MSIRKTQGFIAIALIVFIVIIGFVGATAAFFFVSSSYSGLFSIQNNQAFYLAESGLERATRGLLNPVIGNATGTAERIACANISGNGNFTNVSLTDFPGVFTVTASSNYPSSPATLSAAITSTTSTSPIRVSTISGYSSVGRIMIDRELINYGGTSNDNTVCGGTAPCFVGIVRGADSTNATTHPSGTRVGQYQCDLVSSGGVPNLTSPSTQRVVNEGVQIQEAWIGGQVSSGHPTMARFDGTTWANYPNAFTGTNINSISMISYSDGFGVGNNATGEFIIRWDGNTWTRFPVSAGIPNTDLYSIYCNASNDCWAVGANAAGELIIYWNGLTWTRIGPSGSLPNVNLRGVTCVNSSDCWAVGEPSGDEVILHYNGAVWSQAGPYATVPNVRLNAVTCVTSSDCWLVGNASATHSVTAHWDGLTWALLGNAALPSSRLNSVSCVASNDCWAVGDSVGGAAYYAHWDGTAWARSLAIVSVPTVNLNSVACANTNDCWAVGDSASGPVREVITHWDGTNWNFITPSAIPDANLLTVAIIHPNSQPFSGWMENYS